MTWLLFALLAPLTWAATNVIDKYLLAKWFKQPWLIILAFGIVGLLVSAGIYLIRGFEPLSWRQIAPALSIGMLYIGAEYLYYKAAQVEEISRVISLIYLDPLFTAVLSAVFLGEIFGLAEYAGVILLVAGAVIISYKKSQGWTFNRAAWLCIISALLFGVCNLLVKYSLSHADYWTVFAYIRIGSFIAVLPLMVRYGRPLLEAAAHQTKIFSLMVVNNGLILLAGLFFTVAASLGYITLTSALSATQPFFVLVLALVFSAFYPHILKEEVGRRVFSQKLLAIILMFVGVVLIT